MAKTDKQLHIAMFPWLAMGHIFPNFELAKLFAQKGHSITLISTPRNISRLPQIPTHLEQLIKLVSLPILPKHKANLPENAESTMDVTPNKVPYLKMAYDGLQESLTQLLKSSAPDWILYDFAADWLPPLVHSLQIRCVFFVVSPAWNLCFFDTPKPQLGSAAVFRTKPEDYLRPPSWVPFHSNIGLKLHEVKKMFEGVSDKETGVTVSFNFNKAVSSCDLFSFRSCYELESEWLNLVEDIYKRPVVPVGVIPPSFQVRIVNEEDNKPEWLKIQSWLDKQEQGSVVYIAFGSELKLGQQDLTELALGLELSGLPFFWALRKQQDSSSVDLPDGFEDRVSDRGVVCRDWVPQLKILAHGSIGGYLTHCGSGSVIEGLHFGRVLVMLPYLLDQALYARVLEEKKLGVEIPRNEQDGSFTRSSVAKSVKLAIVDEGGSIYRDKAKEMGLVFSDKDRHEQYIENFLQHLQHKREPFQI
ncbi:UDP-glycosyltransferase [Quillaja saponaria]|uniref:UDP-glycosyltransferase n=1 Tax=Quillaja saponaria TaxID=32244 RepID=A0AAD7L2A8_QUISA|nr:UDP-glycosyltransferase [Quillaja saponaria]WEU75091.1 UGT91AR1 [Quillaja saponaria]